VSERGPSPQGALVPLDGGERPVTDGDTGGPPEFGRLAEWLRPNWIRLAGVLLVGAQTWWMSGLLAHSYFKLDDFYYVERSASEGLGWNYLMWVNAGKLTPVGNLIAWGLTRVSPYDWTLISAVTLVLLAAAGLTLLRMLRTLFGDHPGILLLLLIYLLSPLAFPGLSWWSVVLEVLPLEIAIFCAVTAHVRYVRTRRWRHGVTALAWLVTGMLSTDRGVAVPLLLLAVTAAFLTPGTWRRALVATLRSYWLLWSLYAAAMLGYAALYLVQLSTSSLTPGLPGPGGGIFDFAWTLFRLSFIPGMLGGPWRWFANGGYAVANPPAALTWVALAVAGAVVLVSIWGRLRAWRAWIILAGWVVLVDCLPVLLGRGEFLPGRLLGQETRYVMEAPGIAVLVIGLAFLPVLTTSAPSHPAGPVARTSVPMGRAATGAIVGLLTAVLIGSAWSFHAYVAGTPNAPARSYFATARLALAGAPAGTVVVDSHVPGDVLGVVLGRAFRGPAGQTSQVLAPLVDPAAQLTFTRRPNGTYDHLLEFDGWGRLVPAGILGTGSGPRPASRSCWPQTPAGVVVPLQGTPTQVNELEIDYVAGAAGLIFLTYAGHTEAMNLRHGLHSLFLPVSGRASTVTITGMPPKQLCIGSVQAGVVFPSVNGHAIPALAVNG
jgi:hypothetical protein